MPSEVTPLELEARLNAHRELLIDVLAALIGGQSSSKIAEDLRGDAVPADFEEDPGVLPDQAFAIENETANEIRRILDAARERAKAV